MFGDCLSNRDGGVGCKKIYETSCDKNRAFSPECKRVYREVFPDVSFNIINKINYCEKRGIGDVDCRSLCELIDRDDLGVITQYMPRLERMCSSIYQPYCSNVTNVNTAVCKNIMKKPSYKRWLDETMNEFCRIYPDNALCSCLMADLPAFLQPECSSADCKIRGGYLNSLMHQTVYKTGCPPTCNNIIQTVGNNIILHGVKQELTCENNIITPVNVEEEARKKFLADEREQQRELEEKRKIEEQRKLEEERKMEEELAKQKLEQRELEEKRKMEEELAKQKLEQQRELEEKRKRAEELAKQQLEEHTPAIIDSGGLNVWIIVFLIVLVLGGGIDIFFIYKKHARVNINESV